MGVFASVTLGLGVWVALGLGVALAWGWWQRRLRLVGQVIVNLDDGTGIRGVLVRTSRKTLVLCQAELLGEDTEPISLDGTVHVDRASVHFVQGL